MLTDELLRFLYDGRTHALRRQMANWLASSKRFAAFVNDNQAKIRKKLRTALEPETARGLELELETAYLLLRERTLTVVYEPQQHTRQRGPDFAVSYTTHCTFMVEVTRLKSGQPATPATSAGQATGSGNCPATFGDRFAGAFCSKLGQLLPGHCNVLIIGVEGGCPPVAEVDDALYALQRRAEANDPLLLRHGFRDRGAFFRQFQRLSTLLVRPVPLEAGSAAVAWDNSQGKVALPAKVRTALLASQRG